MTETAWDSKVYPEKLTHTYRCNGCRYEFRFDPNDTRKARCEILSSQGYLGHQGYLGDGEYTTLLCKNRGYGCCHHYETIINVNCGDCGQEYDPRSPNHHCSSQHCSSCGWAVAGTHIKGDPKVKLVTVSEEIPKVRKCNICFREDAVIEVLQGILAELKRLKG